MTVPHITICICTCARPVLLERLLREVASQDTKDAFTFSAVVTDNDPRQSAQDVVRRCARETGLVIRYAVEPVRNIALARNTALANAQGEFVVFIDDDEFPVALWLFHLFDTCRTTGFAGVLGPVKPQFEEQTPQWIIKGRFYDRPTYPTGFELSWHECRTGNVLLRHSILPQEEPPFRREFGTGGEDQDFFRRMMERGHRFVWCNEAVAYEVVPLSRCGRRFLLSRALLRGKNSWRLKQRRFRNLLKSIVAVPAYLMALPFLLLAGEHYFMRYSVKLVDHGGRLLASIGLNPVSERKM